jgi:trimeric autotransporter adhesin
MQEDKATAKRVAEEEAAAAVSAAAIAAEEEAAAAITAASVAAADTAAALDAISAAAIAAAGNVVNVADTDTGADIPLGAASGMGSSSAISTLVEDRLAVSFEPAATDVPHATSGGSSSASAALDCTPVLFSHSDHTADAFLFPHDALLSAMCVQQEKEKEVALSAEDIISCSANAQCEDRLEQAREAAAAHPVLDTHDQQ